MLNTLKKRCLLANELLKLTFGVDTGSFTAKTKADVIADGNELENYFHDDAKLYRDGDIIIDYDFMDDEIPKDKKNAWFDLYQKCHESIDEGFETITENDGSGGGLHYGGYILRAPRTTITFDEEARSVTLISKDIITDLEGMDYLEEHTTRAEQKESFPASYDYIIHGEQYASFFSYGSPQISEEGWKISIEYSCGSFKMVIQLPDQEIEYSPTNEEKRKQAVT